MSREALVIGGGVAGPVAAMALQQAGIDATVYEARPGSGGDVGAFLTLQANGVDALRAIGADGAVAHLGFATPAMTFYSGTGKRLGQMPLGAPGPDGHVSFTLRRSDLYRSLRDEAARRGIRVVHGKRFVDAEGAAGGVRAIFADGTGAVGDLLVGCDGLRSRVRSVLDPEAPLPRHLGLLNIGGFASGVDTGARPGEYAMVFGKRAFFGWTVAPDGDVWWFANPPAPHEPAPGELEATSDARWRDLLQDLFAGDRSPACRIVDATPGPLRGWSTHDLPRVPTWHRDSMVVLGDAAHAMSPSAGQGASLAIEDAVVLAQCLRDAPSVGSAFAAYERRRRDRVERVVAEGARWSTTKVAGPVARRLRDALLPLALRRVGSGTSSEIAGHRIDWDQRAA